MASGGYPNFYSSVSSHRGGRHGGRLGHFRCRGRGKEMSNHQKDTDHLTQSNKSDYLPYDEQSAGFESASSLHGTDILSSSSSHPHGGRGGRFRHQGRGRGSRRPYGQRSHLKDQPDSK